MKAFRLQNPRLFWGGTICAIVESGLVAPVAGLFSQLMPYSVAGVAEYDLLLPWLPGACVALFPWLALAVGLGGAVVVLISASCSDLRGPTRIGLTVLGLILTIINLMWGHSVLLLR